MTSTPLLTIDGTVSIRERVAIPAGAIASIKLVDSTGEVLAATAVQVDGVPAPFHLAADPAFQTVEGSLLLWAALRTEDHLWGTPDLVPVLSDTADLMLQQIEE
ncbi:YbaY family lipoprotein [Aeromicrobium sp. CF3.5]|uniref:YbaY family lipoprotein n=1 Tax=Aeromicrobium sp. CF3.5 TaxID=3373078 RepID=UPI003EE57BF1